MTSPSWASVPAINQFDFERLCRDRHPTQDQEKRRQKFEHTEAEERLVPAARRHRRTLGILAKLNAHSEGNPNGIQELTRTPSECRDAGISIVQEVFGF